MQGEIASRHERIGRLNFAQKAIEILTGFGAPAVLALATAATSGFITPEAGDLARLAVQLGVGFGTGRLALDIGGAGIKALDKRIKGYGVDD